MGTAAGTERRVVLEVLHKREERGSVRSGPTANKRHSSIHREIKHNVEGRRHTLSIVRIHTQVHPSTQIHIITQIERQTETHTQTLLTSKHTCTLLCHTGQINVWKQCTMEQHNTAHTHAKHIQTFMDFTDWKPCMKI